MTAAPFRSRSVPAVRHAAFLVLAFLVASCSARPAPPSADVVQRPFPDVGGRTVMVMPVQGVMPTVAVAAADSTRHPVLLGEPERLALEAELVYWLQQRAPRVRWVATDVVERRVRQSPMIDVHVRELAVQDFQRARLQAIGDPLYGQLRRVAALMDARGALVPIGAVWIPEQGGTGRIHLAAALVDTFGGDVLWQGVVAGAPAELNDGNAIASTAQALARLVPQ